MHSFSDFGTNLGTTGTWGLFGVNHRIWNKGFSEIFISKEARDPIVHASRVANAVLGCLGYIPGVNYYSGISRMVWGSTLIYKSLHQTIDLDFYSDKKPKDARYINIYGIYKRGVFIGVCQITRGALEMLNMRKTNLALGFLLTVPNLIVDIIARQPAGSVEDSKPNTHENPEYSWLFAILTV